MNCTIVIRDNLWAVAESDTPGVQQLVRDALTFRPKGYIFTGAYKMGYWDGTICLAKKDGRFPAGLVAHVVESLKVSDIEATIEDRRIRPQRREDLFTQEPTVKLKDYQEQAVAAACAAGRGIVHHPVGSGKTIVLLEIVKRLGVPALALVHRKDLLYQLAERARDIYHIKAGIVGDGRWEEGEGLTVATFQTIYSRLRSGYDTRDMEDWLRQFQGVQVDEVHHVEAETYGYVMEHLPNAYYRFGYCVGPDTRVLTADLRWLPAGQLKVGDRLVGFEEETFGRRRPRKMVPTKVTATGRDFRACCRVTFSSGEAVICSTEHPWLVYLYRGSNNLQWQTTEQLRKRGLPVRIPRFLVPWSTDVSNGAGYLAGAFDSEGNRSLRSGRMRGLVFTQRPNIVWETVRRSLKNIAIGFTEHADRKGLRIAALPMHSMFRFLGSIRPPRLLQVWESSKWPALYRCSEEEIISIEGIGLQEIVTLSTSAGTYLAEGFGSHNSATPFRSGDKGTYLNVVGWTGPVVSHLPSEKGIAAGRLVPADVFIVSPVPGRLPLDMDYQTAYTTGITAHVGRNDTIIRLAQALRKTGPTLILVERIEHGQRLARELDVPFMSGSTSGSERVDKWEDMRQGRLDCVVASVIADEGLDIPNIENLILAGGGRAPHRQIQRIGRGMRKVAGKDRLTVIDFADRGYYLGRQANSRRRAYQKEKAYTLAEVRPEEINQWLT